jgi:hypothetical protein
MGWGRFRGGGNGLVREAGGGQFRDIAAFGDGDAPGIEGALLAIIVFQFLAEEAGGGADDVILHGIVVFRAAEDVDADLLLGEAGTVRPRFRRITQIL